MTSDNYNPLASYMEPTWLDQLRTKLRLPERRLDIHLVLALLLAVAMLYGGFLRNPLVFDDYNLLNEATLKSYAQAPFALSVRWLTTLSFSISYLLFESNWLWYRVGNLMLHAATAGILFSCLLALLRAVCIHAVLPTRLGHQWAAFAGAVFFALHPVAVYGVGYLVERSVVMATLFSILALHCYLNAVLKHSMRWLAGAVAAYVLALSSKEHAVMLPLVAISLSLLLREPNLARFRKLYIPMGLFAGLGAVVAVFFVYQQKSILGQAYEPQAFEIFAQMRQRAMGPTLENAFGLSALTQAHLFYQYLLTWVFPYLGWMSIDVRQPFATGFFAWPYIASAAGFVLYPLTAVYLISRRGRVGLIGFGLLVPWLMFLPELSVVRVAEIFVLYRSYLWMWGISIVIACVFVAMPRRPAFVGMGLLGLLLFLLAWNRLDTFSDHVKLWSDAVQANQGKVNQGAERAYFKRGLAYREFGQYDRAIDDFRAGYALISSTPSYANAGDKAVIYFQFNYLVEVAQDLKELKVLSEAIRLNPSDPDLYMRRGKVYVSLFKPLQAVTDFSEAIRLTPHDPSDALRTRAMVLFKAGGVSDALDDLNRAIAHNPKSAKAHMARGIVLASKGGLAAGLADLDKAVALAPNDAEVHFNRGNVLLLNGRLQDAFKQFGRAVELDPKLADAFVNRGGILMQAGRLDEALEQLNQALTINPDIENAYMNRAKIYLARKEKNLAMADYGRVLKLNHQNKVALYERGMLLEEFGIPLEARILFRRSCDVGYQLACEKAKAMTPR